MSKSESKSEHKSEHRPAPPWSVPVALADVPESGLHFALSADPATRAAVAALAGVSAISRLDATFDITRHGRAGLHVAGQVSGAVQQTCVVTLDPVENDVREAVALDFLPPGAAPAEPTIEAVLDPEEVDPPEPLVDGTIDLGQIATEFLVLGIDPYPRKPDAVFSPPATDADTDSPFAALAPLKKGPAEPE